MSADAVEVLNRVLVTLRRSFMQYLRYARPFTPPGREQAIETIHKIAEAQDALAERVFDAVVRSGGLPEHNGNFAGHAIGLEQRELPYILTDPAPVKSQFLPDTTDTPIEEGTTLCIENPVQVFGIGGTQIEKTVRVTRTGYEFLCNQERKLWASA